MDDERTERKLREGWPTDPPDGMRERVLRRARAELQARRRPRWGFLAGWQRALAAAAVAAVVAAGASDAARSRRLAAMTGTPGPAPVQLPVREWIRQRQELARLFDDTPAASPAGETGKEGSL